MGDLIVCAKFHQPLNLRHPNCRQSCHDLFGWNKHYSDHAEKGCCIRFVLCGGQSNPVVLSLSNIACLTVAVEQTDTQDTQKNTEAVVINSD